MRIGKIQIEVKASRWPWQEGYNWRGMTNSTAPLNMSGARFGGGWRYKFGFAWSGKTLMLDLLFGIVSIRVFDWVKDEEIQAKFRADRDEILRQIDERNARAALAKAKNDDDPF